MAIVKEYKKEEDVINIVRETMIELYTKESQFREADPNKMVTIETGLGGFMNIDKALKEQIINSGLVITASKSNMDTHEIGMGKIMYTIPHITKVLFRLTPLMDPVGEPTDENPYIDGFRKSSYSYIIKNEDNKVIAELTIAE